MAHVVAPQWARRAFSLIRKARLQHRKREAKRPSPAMWFDFGRLVACREPCVNSKGWHWLCTPFNQQVAAISMQRNSWQ